LAASRSTPDTIENELKKSTTPASLMPTSTLPLAFLDGKAIAAGCISCTESRMRLSLILRVGITNVPWKKAAGSTSTFPFEQWRYRYLEGVGQEVIMSSWTPACAGDYHMTMDRSKRTLC